MILYACSMDHYGPVTSTPHPPLSPSGVVPNGGTAKWNFSDTTMIGDGWAAEPSYTYREGSFNRIPPRGTIGIAKPAWGARQGEFALVADSFAVENMPGATVGAPASYAPIPQPSMRLVIPGASQHTRLVHFAFSISALPLLDRAHGAICTFLNSGGQERAMLFVDNSGRLVLTSGDDSKLIPYTGTPEQTSALLTTASPIISPQTWYYFSMKIVTNGDNGTADFDLYVGDIEPENLLLSGDGLAFTNSGEIDMIGFLPASLQVNQTGPTDSTIRAIRDIVICDTSGDRNNDLLGQCFVSAQELRTESPGGGWHVHHRQHFGDGILDAHTNNTGLRCADSADFELGTADFTLESFVRFASLPTSGGISILFSKWATTSNQRSYRLAWHETDETLRWEVSTDGINTTTVKQLPWQPLTGRWYHIAVVRDTGETKIFIDGKQLGVPLADANDYFAGTAPFGIGARFNGTTTLVTTDVFDGWMDETRLTVGLARYSADFAVPTDRFGRNSSDDPDFLLVSLLLGYDGGSITDESSFARTVSLGSTGSPVAAIIPDDAAQKSDVLNARPAVDDTYLEAPNLYAEGVFTFTDLPTAADTITVGSITYTWVSSLVSANDVLIGSDIGECIENIIAAINGGDGEGTVYGNGTTANTDAVALEFLSPQFNLRAQAIGTAGNAVATTTTMTNGSFRDSTLLGGEDIPADSDFTIERLPPDATGVLGIQVTARHYKTDAGTASIRYDLIGPSGGVAQGDDLNPDLSPAWARQIIEEDPDTSGALTASTVIGGKIRLKRTA